ncbi:MAG: 30S ribosomal protein S6 [Deltaproteobacteria bacterium]|nr:30S ribosomal protein S6 [Deltaproteobacteria bacterium]
MLQNEYETVIIIRPDLDDAVTYAIVENLEAVIATNGGQLLYRDDWGKRKLAYPIKRHQKGHYVLETYVAPANIVLEFERKIRIEDNIIRFLTSKVAENVDIAERMEKAEEYRIKKAQEAEKARIEALQAEEERKRAAENDYYDNDDVDLDN